MNIVQLHYKTEFFLDSVRAPRFNKTKMDEAINTAINDIVLDRYHNIRAQPKEYAFQTSQRLRDELYTIVKNPGIITASGGIIPKASFPTDYMLLLNMKANISGEWMNTIPVTYDELNMLEISPYHKPSITDPKRVYRIESQVGVTVVFGDVGVLLEADINYIAKPVTVLIGTEVSLVGETVNAGNDIIAYVDSVIKTGPSIQLINLKKGEKYTVGQNSEAFITLNSGILFTDFVDTDLPEMLHEEIARKAAKVLSGNVENYDRDMSLEKDIKNTEN